MGVPLKLFIPHLAAAAALMGACGAGTQAHGPPSECAVSRIPMVPPDSVPAWVYARGNAVEGTWITGRYARDVLMVSFVAGTDERARADAVCAVQGEVIGGQRPQGAEGFYYIRIPSDPAQQRMRRAVEILDALPQVILVTPEFVDNALGPI